MRGPSSHRLGTEQPDAVRERVLGGLADELGFSGAEPSVLGRVDAVVCAG